MAADTKGDRWVWTVLGAVSVGLVAAAGYLYQINQRDWSFYLFILGLIGFAILILRLLVEIVPPLRAGLSNVSRSALGFLRRIGRAMAGVCVGIGARVLRPFVEHIVRGDEASQAALPQPSPWTAGLQPTGNHGLDSHPIHRDGFRVSAAQFVVFPDYRSKGLNVGFALAPWADSLDLDNLQGALCVVAPLEPPRQTLLVSLRDREPMGSRPITPNPSKANFLVGVAVFPGRDANRLQLNVNVDGEGQTDFDVPADYARYLILVAWAEGQEFRVDFTQIHVSWVPE